MKIPNEETLEFYRTLTTHPVGIPKVQIPQKANINMTDSELVAFYSERYIDVDVAEFLLKDRKDRLYGLCNLVKQGEFYLDVGCANGAHMDVLHQRGIEGIGLDLSIPNILRGRQKYPQLKFIHGYAEEIPFKDNYFDIVLLGDAIEHFRDPKVALAECLRVAKKGLVICVPIKEEITEEHINPFTDEKFLNLLEFYKLNTHFYDQKGKELTKIEALLGLQKFLWLLVRVEKTPDTNNIVTEILSSSGKELEIKAKEEILNKDQWTKDFGHMRHETEIARFKLISHLIEGNKVLEIGCGNGDGSVEIAKNGFEVVGIDISESGIIQAFEIAKKEKVLSKTNFLAMDATKLSFPDNSFDSIVIPEVLEHIRSPRKILEEAIRVVRNGGRIIISIPDGLLIPWEGHLRVFFKDTLTAELGQYSSEIEWYELPFKKWIICSFFVKKNELDIEEGPLIDILMPTFNGRKTIKKAIFSVVNQTYQNWNLIIVIDGGEDIREIIKEFHDNRIKYFNTNHEGKSHALNVGIKKSNGEYITYLDDDDILYPIHLEILLNTALEKKQDLVYADWYEVSVDENNKEIQREIEFRLDVTPAMLIFQNYINHKCILHKRSLMTTVGIYDENLSFLIDWDMIRRLAFVSKPYHRWSFTSERIRYYNKGILQNRITGLWSREPEKIRNSIVRIVDKTVELQATSDELKEAIRKSMLSLSYYHSLNFNNTVQSKDGQITELSNALKARDSQINELNNNLQTKDGQITEFNSKLQTRDGQITELNNLVQTKESQITEYNSKVQAKDSQITELNNLVQTKESQITELNSKVQANDELIRNLEKSVQVIYGSVMWRIVLKYRRLIESILPFQTKRRRYYNFAIKGFRIIMNEGLGHFFSKFKGWLLEKKRRFAIKKMLANNNVFNNDDLELINLELRNLKNKPKISIIVPVYNVEGIWLEKCIYSVLNQYYDNWELCLIDDSSTKVHIKSLLKDYSKKDSRIMVKFLEKNKGISEATNEGIKLTTGDFIAFLDDDDELTKDALSEVVKILNTYPDTDVIYSDEDKISVNGELFEPFFKPDWSPEYFRGVMYVGHLLVIRKALVEKIGYLKKEFDNVQDYEYMLRISENTRTVRHIPKILYHWRKIEGSIAQDFNSKGDIIQLQVNSVNSHLKRLGLPAIAKKGNLPHRVFIYPEYRKTFPLVSIIIPTKNSPELLGQCLKSIFNLTSYPNFEVILIDNYTNDKNALEIIKSFPVTKISLNGIFNYSVANNLGVDFSKGEFLVFLNNDTEVVTKDWIEHLLYYIEQQDIAAAGPLLIYPDGRVQHAGLVLGFRGTADHLMKNFPSDCDGYAGSLSCAREVSAITGACMMVQKSLFKKVGGFNIHYANIYQDVDLCLKFITQGYRIIYTPRAVLKHFESGTRDNRYYDFIDRYLLLDQWHELIYSGDPYYNPNFDLKEYEKGKTGYSISLN